jgi:hypothetical protein
MPNMSAKIRAEVAGVQGCLRGPPLSLLLQSAALVLNSCTPALAGAWDCALLHDSSDSCKCTELSLCHVGGFGMQSREFHVARAQVMPDMRAYH